MNKVCLTRKGIQFFNEEQEDYEEPSRLKSTNYLGESKRSGSLPQLMSTAAIAEKQEISSKLSQLTLKLSDLKGRGLRKIIIQQEDQHLTKIMQEQFSSRKQYLQSIVPVLVKRTRDNLRFGNLQSRLQRGRAYIDRLEHNFDKKFVFKPPKKIEETA